MISPIKYGVKRSRILGPFKRKVVATDKNGEIFCIWRQIYHTRENDDGWN